MKQGLSLRVSQHLALTPQLQQSIRLLQLSTLELQTEIEQMLDDNPFLERADDDAPEFAPNGVDGAPEQISPAEDAIDSIADYAGSTAVSSPEGSDDGTPVDSLEPGWEGDGESAVAPDDSEWGCEARARNASADAPDDNDPAELARQQESLQDHLHRQALGLRLSPTERAALSFLIESLNDDGYLEDTLEGLTDALEGSDTAEREALLECLSLALRWLQSLEPTGVGARDLGECLRLQLQVLLAQTVLPDERTALELALHLCAQPLDLLARRDVRRLATACKASESAVRGALTRIARLEPKPGRRFANVQRHELVPDVLVRRVGNGALLRWQVQLNPDVMPRLRVQEIYAQALKGHKGGARDSASYAALQQRLQEARWFIKNIQQRFDTILRVSTSIVERQKSFFTHGELAMRPLVLREIADELGLHESTISRVTSAKYMATPQGTFELKYFFGSALGTDSGGNASSTAVRALLRQFIGAEQPAKPLSDSQLSEMLKEQGIDCARRTVAKYREALRIAPANLRKSL